MSMSALCLAVRNDLRTMLGVPSATYADASLICDLAFEGMPHPAAGEVFYAVHDGGWNAAQTGDYDLFERMTVSVTITKKVGYTPKDRRATDAWATSSTGLDALARAVVKRLHQNQAIRLAANVIIGATDTLDSNPNGFETTVIFQGGSNVQQHGPEWFESPQYSGVSVPDKTVAISVRLDFGMADRLQGISGLT